ncbi:Glyoxalase family protein [Pseudomonas chlororaphis]|uniref:Bleomycin resistance protein n=1 Tax=Pseudomonas chlororaphis TaxID=587753 RepID=A0A3G7TIM4_9PSED|nr:glyoxalase superfamily protein [Pseudomonas chlororaphis]AZE46488.1 Glyoxalase family protein [Pseudomonas chlororaphis]
MSFGRTTPILRIFDEAKAREFYIDFLGFTLDWQHRFEDNFPLYMQVSRGECVLHLSEHHGDSTPGSALRIETDGLEAFQQQLLAKDYRFAHAQIQAMPWGSQDLTVLDPFGNRLVFTNAISV